MCHKKELKLFELQAESPPFQFSSHAFALLAGAMLYAESFISEVLALDNYVFLGFIYLMRTVLLLRDR